jgi:hypothetical protein
VKVGASEVKVEAEEAGERPELGWKAKEISVEETAAAEVRTLRMAS